MFSSPHLRELERQHAAQLANITEIRSKADSDRRALTETETEMIGAHTNMAKRLEDNIADFRSKNSLAELVHQNGPEFLYDAGKGHAESASDERRILSPNELKVKVSAMRNDWKAWFNSTLRSIGGLAPKMEATAPSGPISFGGAGGTEGVGFIVPTEVMPGLNAFFALDSFGQAGAFQIQTDHIRPINFPVFSAGAASSSFAELAEPTTSQPFALSGFTFGGTKYASLVLASYEALMNSEVPLDGKIQDELLARIATSLTQAATVSLYDALTAYTGIGGGPSAMLVTGSDIYQTVLNLRYAVPPRFDKPTNKFMLSRATLATIKNFRASTSGVPMFDAVSNTIFGREYVINDFFDTNAASNLVVYGDWSEGAFIRSTGLFVRVFLELYAASGEVGFRVQRWQDSHFLAELAGAAQPPTYQPLFYAIA